MTSNDRIASIHNKPNEAQLRLWDYWVQTRPKIIQDLIAGYQLNPWHLYIQKSTGCRVMLHSINENGTVSISRHEVHKLFNRDVFLNRTSFGVSPDDLELCYDYVEEHTEDYEINLEEEKKKIDDELKFVKVLTNRSNR
jgi:hypothetical protein